MNFRGRIIIAKIISAGANYLSHLINGAAYFALSIAYQVANIAAPSAEVSVGHRCRRVGFKRVIGYIHAAKHMGKIHCLPVRNSECIQVAKRRRSSSVLGVFCAYIIREFFSFFTCKHRPVATDVLFHTAADVVDYKLHFFFALMLFCISVGVAFEDF